MYNKHVKFYIKLFEKRITAPEKMYFMFSFTIQSCLCHDNKRNIYSRYSIIIEDNLLMDHEIKFSRFFGFNFLCI